MTREHLERIRVAERKGDRIFVWSVLFIHAILLGWIAVLKAPVVDEVAHLPSGLSHWQFRRFNLYRVNPPLVRMIATLPLLLMRPKMDWGGIPDGPYLRAEFIAGNHFMEANGYDAFRYFTICRWALIPVSVFGGWICYRWARELFGRSSAMIAVILWCSCPNVLAWGSTIMPDVGAAAFGVGVGYAFWCWLKSPAWSSALIAGFALGLAELSKSTWIIDFALLPLTWLVWRLAARRPGMARPPALQLVVILLVAVYALNFGYAFQGSIRCLGEFAFISHALAGKEGHGVPGNRFGDTWLGAMLVPVPADYLEGIDIQKHEFEKGKWSYLRGEQRLGGWWYYYLYGLAVKTPLGTILLVASAAVLLVWRQEYRSHFKHEVVLLAPAIAVLILVSSQTGFNRHLRYALPAIPFLYIFASRVGIAFDARHAIPRFLAGSGTIAAVLGSMAVYPHSMSFFNRAAGGPLGGPAHLLDSNIDWGQDLLELRRFLDRHPGIGRIGLAYYGYVDPKFAGIDYVRPPQQSGDRLDLEPGWYAISVCHLFGYKDAEFCAMADYTYFRRFVPCAMAGYSIYIYHLTAEAIDRANRRVGGRAP